MDKERDLQRSEAGNVPVSDLTPFLGWVRVKIKSTPCQGQFVFYDQSSFE